MNETLKVWLAELKENDLVCDPLNVSNETKNNYWSFTFPEEDDVDASEAEEFFEAIAALKAEQCIGKMLFYVWYDEMSHHLCYCVASVSKEELPFGCTVLHAGSLIEVVAQHFDTNTGGFIPGEELEEIPLEEAFSDEEPEIEFELKVWCKELSGTCTHNKAINYAPAAPDARTSRRLLRRYKA